MPVPVTPRLEAVTFQGTFTTGRTRPCIFSCEFPDGSSAGEYVVKLAGGIERGPSGLASEFVASRLALALGVPVPAPGVVHISKELVGTVRDVEARRILERSTGENFGTSYLSGGFSTWPVRQSVTSSQAETAADIFAFDVLIANPDRRRDKPNLLFRGDDLFAIDHEMAFSFMLDLKQPKDPAEHCSVERLAFLKEHVFYVQLRKKALDFTRIDGAALAINEAVLDSIETDMPEAWKTHSSGLILPYVKAVLRRAPSFARVAKEFLAV